MLYLIGCILTLFFTTLLTRTIPFAFVNQVKENRKIQSIGKTLPPAIMLLLCLQCMTDVKYTEYPYGITEIVSSILVIALHMTKRNTLLSIMGGTLIYGILFYFFS
jgi:branched-subunit amino acid transport protein AzlD